MSFGDGRRRSAHPQGTCPDAFWPEGASELEAVRIPQQLKVEENLRKRTEELVSAALQGRRELPTRFHGAVLWLEGWLLTWLRPWDAQFAAHRAPGSLVSCWDMILIASAAAVQSRAERGWWMPAA